MLRTTDTNAIEKDLLALGVQEGDDIFVRADLGAIGRVKGEAFIELLFEQKQIMPIHSDRTHQPIQVRSPKPCLSIQRQGC